MCDESIVEHCGVMEHCPSFWVNLVYVLNPVRSGELKKVDTESNSVFVGHQLCQDGKWRLLLLIFGLLWRIRILNRFHLGYEVLEPIKAKTSKLWH